MSLRIYSFLAIQARSLGGVLPPWEIIGKELDDALSEDEWNGGSVLTNGGRVKCQEKLRG